MNNNLTAEVKCPNCKIGFEVDVELEEGDQADFEGEDSFDIDFDEMQCPNCENYFAMHGKVTKVDDTLTLAIESID